MSFQPQLLSNNFTSIYSAEIRNGMASMTRTLQKTKGRRKGVFLKRQEFLLVERCQRCQRCQKNKDEFYIFYFSGLFQNLQAKMHFHHCMCKNLRKGIEITSDFCFISFIIKSRRVCRFPLVLFCML